jgi:hypothetical protein
VLFAVHDRASAGLRYVGDELNLARLVAEGIGVKNSLVLQYRHHNGGYLVEYDLGLQPTA